MTTIDLSVVQDRRERAEKSERNEKLEERMAQVRSFITAGLAIRKSEGVRVRQPLAAVTVPGAVLEPDLEALIRDELNVKAVRYESGAEVALDLTLTTALTHEGWAREMMRTIQDLRKEAGFNMGETAKIRWHSDSAEVGTAIETWIETIARETSSTVERGVADPSVKIHKEFELAAGHGLWVSVY